MPLRIELFYSPACPYCPEAKRILREILERIDQEFHVDEVNVFSPEGLERAKRYGIISVPTIIVVNRHKNRRCSRKGDPSRKN